MFRTAFPHIAANSVPAMGTWCILAAADGVSGHATKAQQYLIMAKIESMRLLRFNNGKR
jgi:hypothetical protein